MSNSHPEPGLRGRRAERAELDRLLADARAGQSRVLVLRGEAGIGKTTLLYYLCEQASGFRVVRAAGVESEMELAFAGLHQLCTPMLGDLGALSGPQRQALDTVFGLCEGEPPGLLLVGLAVLGLLSEAAGEQPLMCLVDDAQWLDQASAQVLAFVARRLLAEPVALVFAVREPGGGKHWEGLPLLTVGGLRDSDARALLESVTMGRLDERVRDRIVAETRGNPLALLELPRGLSAAELAGGFGLPDALPLAIRIERSFQRRLRRLPAATRRLVLAAAAEPTGDVALLWRAAERLGVGTDAAAPAKTAELMELGARVRFRHPLLRAAVYRAAALPDRREVHQALAEATDPDNDPERRAWHRASAANGPDEAVAGELECSAARAQGRGGFAAAAAFLQRSAELTPDPARRGTRALSAARAKFAAGAPDAAYDLLAMAELGRLDERQRAEMARLRAHMTFERRHGSDAPRLLLDAAEMLGPLDRDLARDTYLEAIGAALFAGRLGDGLSAREVAETSRRSVPGSSREPRSSQEPGAADLLLDGVTAWLTVGYAAGMPALRRALDSLLSDGGRGEVDVMGWLVAPELWDDEAWHQLTVRAVRFARETGDLAALPVALVYRAAVYLHEGEFGAAAALNEEAIAIAAATGNAFLGYISMMLAAWRGEETRAPDVIKGVVEDATARGEGRALGLAWYATAVLRSGLGDYESALVSARRACEHDDLGFYGWSLAEFIEAGARSGATGEAAAVLERLGERARAAGTPWALGIHARSRALLSDGPVADALYREAIGHLERSRMAVHLARAHLVYGEWLRREQRQVEARGQLRVAHDMFGRFGAAAFAERARRELQAAGETASQRTRAAGALTAQEAQVARLAARGHTNPEIGGRLFISPRTAEYHLHKVFAKLGISSRRQLRERLAQLG